jgi:hypothetical protein
MLCWQAKKGHADQRHQGSSLEFLLTTIKDEAQFPGVDSLPTQGRDRKHSEQDTSLRLDCPDRNGSCTASLM